MSKKKNPLLEAVKEFGRIALLSLLPLVITALEAGHLFTQATLFMLFIASLRAFDAYIHQRKDLPVNGLIPF